MVTRNLPKRLKMENNQEFVEWTQPLSPVLNSSKNSNKLREKKNKPNKSKAKLFETEYLSEQEKNEIFIKSQSNTASRKQEGKLDLCMNKEEVQIPNSSKMVNSTFGFKTALGKELFLKDSSSDYANKLFVDILDPTSLHNRDNKYSFLSTNPSSIIPETLNSKDEEFLGFDIEEYISSRKIFEIVQTLLNVIYTGVYNKDEINKKEYWSEFNISDLNRKRKFEDSVQSDECEIKQPKLSKINMNTIISQNNQLNFHKIGVHNYKNQIESSKKAVEISSINELEVNNENLKNQVQSTKKNELFQPEIDHEFENSVKLENLDNYKDIQRNTPKKIISATCTLDLRNTRDTLCMFQQNENILPEVKNKDTSNEKSKQDEKSKIFDRFGYSSASNNSKFNCAQTNFENELQFSTASGNQISISNAALSKASSIFKDTQDMEVPQEDCTSFGKNNLPLAFESHDKLDNENLKFETFDHTTNLKQHNNFVGKTNKSFSGSFFSYEPQSVSALGFSTASGKDIAIPSACLAKINHIFKDISDIDSTNLNISNSFSKASNYTISTKITGEEIKSSNIQKNESLNNSNSEIKEGFLTPVRNIAKKKRLGTSLCRDGNFSAVALDRVKSLFGDMNFDDLKLPGYLKTTSPKMSTPIRSSGTVSTPQLATNYSSTPIRPVRRSAFDKNDFFLSDFPQEPNCPLLIQKPTAGDLMSWSDELQRQKDILENKMTLISKKQEALSIQIHASYIHGDKPPPSIPKKINKINLKDIQNLEMQSDCLDEINNVILQINPQNAVLIHFNGKWSDTAIITTEDGCTLIPTQQGFIGLSEIEPAFCSMPDVKKTLIPNGWIRNHYKWIIWKLASYERFFPSTLSGCFTVDNVIKQLKYRYYRELYCAERPALRKIYEMDDSSQKRMVLCISNIFKNGNSIELELTDGWYCIRTLIDEPLCHQVKTKKIMIGSKLITSGAELLNCEGCYPLEMEQAQKVRLKINFNSTRRAAWFTKLGYQKHSTPLLIKIGDANPAGGVIGAVKVYIMRTYPLIYREKTENSVVWRNQNAENKMMQEYENKCFKEYEDIVGDRSSTKNADVITRRNVCPLFQMTVIDVMGNKSQPYKCTVWDATEFHTQQLKENQILLIYNLTLRSANELSCNKRTRFEISKENVLEYINYKRKYVALACYDTMLNNSNFGLFDTVGFIVQISVGVENQYFWLTDISKSLLLVEISRGPDRCLLLNRIQEDQPVAVSNLSLKDSFRGYAIATADLNTIVTNYPQYEYLREELEKLKRVNKTELNILLKEVKMKFNKLEKGNSSKCTSDSSTSGSTLNFSRVTSTDIVMSMIDIDDVVNNTK